MKNIIKGLLMLVVLSSCEEVIPIDLDTSTQRPVIEAVINANDGICTVLISKTGGFYQLSDYQKIGGATITLKSSDGKEFLLNEIEIGNYEIGDLEVVPGIEYSIYIDNLEQQNYEATTIAPYPTELLTLRKEEIQFGGDGEYVVNSVVLDAAETKDFYRVKTFVNGADLAEGFYIDNDVLFNGGEIEFFGNIPIEGGSTVTIEVQSIDQETFDYFYQLSENSDKAYNPKGNFNSNALGYFGIYYSDTLTIEL